MRRHFFTGMARASVYLLVFVSVSEAVISAIQRHDSGRFYFVKPLDSRRAGDGCRTCYGDECFDMNYARCELYTATSELLYGAYRNTEEPETPPNDERAQVDSMLMDFVEDASALPVLRECLPLISAYSDCTKENACLGCKSCSCDVEGLWNCSIVQYCHEDPPVLEDHKALVAVIELLMDDSKLSRNKRWVFENSLIKSNQKPHNLSYTEIFKWGEPFNYVNNFTGIAATLKTDGAIVNSVVQTSGLTTPIPNYTEAKIDADYLAFDEVLNNIDVEGKIYNRRRPLDLSNVTVMEHDYMDFENPNETFKLFKHLTDTDHFIDVLNAIEDQNTLDVNADSTTEVLIDLLEVARKKGGINLPVNKSDSKQTKKYSFSTGANFENNYDFIDLNVMKRAIAADYSMNIVSSTDGSTISLMNNNTNTENLLKTGVDVAIDSMIQSKEKELETLIFIRNKLIEYINANESQSENPQLNDNPVIENITKSYYTFYNIVINSETSTDSNESSKLTDSIESRRSGSNKNDSYLEKLKRDILIVMRDLTVLQKLMGGKKFPLPLRNLVRAMRYYIHNAEKVYSDIKNKMPNGRTNFNTRRHWMYSYPSNNDLVKRYIVEILQVIHKHKPQSNTLDSLSPRTRELIRRIIKNLNFDGKSLNFSATIDSNYSLESLRDVGSKWNALALAVINSKPADKLYNLKLFQFALLTDMNKIKDAIRMFDFLHKRRLLPLNDEVSERELLRINTDLKSIHNKINKILLLRNVNKNKPKPISRTGKKKQNLIKHIRNLLKTSKSEIVDLLRRKIPKSEIVKELAKKKLDEITKAKLIIYKNVMKKWQNNLNISRKKRSALNLEDIKKRMKNILPKYLRGKVNTGLKNSTKTKRKRHKLKTKNHSKRNRAATTLKPVLDHSSFNRNRSH